VLLGTDVEGEARSVGAEHIVKCLNYLKRAPAVLISGGETTVTITGNGKGGRNSEYILGAALAAKDKSIYGLAAGTDGLDGNGGCAGALFTPMTLADAAEKGLDPQKFLDANDTGAFFAALDSQIVTGPTRTNVTDLRAILVV
jgi:hydroxypyruvate reductase